MRRNLIEAVAVLTLALASAPGAAAQGWTMPWQISPSTAQVTNTPSEPLRLAYVPGWGFVRGNPLALAALDTPLVETAGPNITRPACQSVVRQEAEKAGAVRIDAVSAEPHTRYRNGYQGQVLFRIVYANLLTYEVRMATLTCQTDLGGAIKDAFVPEEVSASPAL